MNTGYFTKNKNAIKQPFNKKIINKMSAFLAALILLSGTLVFADTTSLSTNISTNGIEAIAYEKAVEIMLENSRELKNIENQIEIQKKAIVEIDREARRLQHYIRDDKDKVLERATKVNLDPMDARKKLTSLERSLDDKKFELKQSVLGYYVNFATIENKKNLYKTILEVQKKEFDQKKIEEGLGKITKNDLLNYQIAYETAVKDMEYANREYNLALLDFNYLIMDTLDIKFSMDISNLEKLLLGNYIDIEKIDLNYLAESNIKEDTSLALLKLDLPRIEEKKRVDQLYSNSVTIEEDYQESLESNRRDTTNRINAIKYGVRSDYYNLKGLALDIRIAQNNLTLAKTVLSSTKARYSLGMVTTLELVKAEKEILSAENAVTNALNAYYKAYHDFVRYY